MEDGWLVLHGVYEEVRLRAGKAVVGIYNENYQEAGPRINVPSLSRAYTDKSSIRSK